ncbi:MAG: hypothetical protein K940chlam3_00878 [Chlamydiae bacterium]|nr:hypothetical protein [Chlamydiota bacterium]
MINYSIASLPYLSCVPFVCDVWNAYPKKPYRGNNFVIDLFHDPSCMEKMGVAEDIRYRINDPNCKEEELHETISELMGWYMSAEGVSSAIMNSGACINIGHLHVKSEDSGKLVLRKRSQFGLLHEISHIKNNDTLYVGLVGLVTSIASTYFSGYIPYIAERKESVQGFLLSHFIGVFSGIIFQNFYWSYAERRADSDAISAASTEELISGVRYFKTIRKISIEAYCSGLTTYFSSEGEFRNDLRYPSLSS